MKHTRFFLRLFIAIGAANIVCAMLAAWQRFDYRAAGFVFCAALGAVVIMQCFARLDELRSEADRADPIQLKCRACGEVCDYQPLKNPPAGREGARPLHCPICGGALDVIEDGPTGGDEA